jgi:hypothetical protein
VFEKGNIPGNLRVFPAMPAMREANRTRRAVPGLFGRAAAPNFPILTTFRGGNPPQPSVMPGHRSGGRLRERAMTDVTRILVAIQDGQAHATKQLFPLVYDELC